MYIRKIEIHKIVIQWSPLLRGLSIRGLSTSRYFPADTWKYKKNPQKTAEDRRRVKRTFQIARAWRQRDVRVTSASLACIRADSAAERSMSGHPLSITFWPERAGWRGALWLAGSRIAAIPLVVFYQNKRQQSSLARVEIPSLGNLGLFRRKDTYKSLGK